MSSLYFLPFFIVLTSLYMRIISFFIIPSQRMTRLQSVTTSPLLSIATETIDGIQNIRAHHLDQFMRKVQQDLLQHNQLAVYNKQIMERWLNIRLDLIGSFVLFGSVLACTLNVKIISGLAITYAMNASNSLMFMFKMLNELQNNFVSVERVIEYCELPIENSMSVSNKLTDEWPNGQITFNNVSMKYRTDLPLVLKNVSFSIKKGEKIGVCGRTGSGKSSLLQVLFKAVPITEGDVTIDGISLNEIPHEVVRKRLGIIGSLSLPASSYPPPVQEC